MSVEKSPGETTIAEAELPQSSSIATALPHNKASAVQTLEEKGDDSEIREKASEPDANVKDPARIAEESDTASTKLERIPQHQHCNNSEEPPISESTKAAAIADKSGDYSTTTDESVERKNESTAASGISQNGIDDGSSKDSATRISSSDKPSELLPPESSNQALESPTDQSSSVELIENNNGDSKGALSPQIEISADDHDDDDSARRIREPILPSSTSSPAHSTTEQQPTIPISAVADTITAPQSENSSPKQEEGKISVTTAIETEESTALTPPPEPPQNRLTKSPETGTTTIDDNDNDEDDDCQPRPVDIHCITDTILAASACVADNPTWEDTGRLQQQEVSSRRRAMFPAETPANTPCHAAAVKQNDDDNDGNALFKTPVVNRKRRRRRRDDVGNCPVQMHSYLKERFANSPPILLFHLSDEPPDDLTRRIFARQIVHLPWNSPGLMSETPTVSTLLQFCYAMKAWLHSGNNSGESALSSSVHSSRDSNAPIAVICCNNGKTRTAIAVACYLKFAGIVDKVQSGFCHFLERRCCDGAPPEQILESLPASLRTFFRNFDTAIELESYLNCKPLLLKAVAIQGVPVEDRPCLDVWDATGRHVYSSHPRLWNDVQDTLGTTTTTTADPSTQYHATSQWADEEGFYRVNCLVQGDFCILCRFGGPYAQDSTDSSKLLFRYANSTAFMGAASPYELPCSRVDLQRRYATFFDEQDFLLSLVFDAYWNAPDEAEKELLQRDCSKAVLPDILTGLEAMESGWHVIVKHHVARPEKQDVDQLIIESAGELEGCPAHIASLALQLSNFDPTMAQTILLEGRLRSWWQPQPDDLSVGNADDAPFFAAETVLDSLERLDRTQALHKIQNLLDAVDVTPRMNSNDLLSGGLQQPTRTAESTGQSGERARSVSEMAAAATVSASTIQSSLNIVYTSPIMRPHPGDVLATLSSSRVASLLRSSDSSFMGEHPLFPLVPHRRTRGNPIPIEDPDNAAAVELLLKLNHPGVDLKDLTGLVEKSRQITSRQGDSDFPSGEKEMKDNSRIENAVPGGQPTVEEPACSTSPKPRTNSPSETNGPESSQEVHASKDSLNGDSNSNTTDHMKTTSIAAGAAAAAAAMAKRSSPSISVGAAAAAAAIAKRDNSNSAGAAAAAAAMAKRNNASAGEAAAATAAAVEKRNDANVSAAGVAAAAAAMAKRNSANVSAGEASTTAVVAKRDNSNLSAGAAAAAAAMAKRNSSNASAGAAAAAAAAAMAKRKNSNASSGTAAAATAKRDNSSLTAGAAAAAAAMAKRNSANATVGGAAAMAKNIDSASTENHPSADSAQEDVVAESGGNDVALKADPNYQKYFKMLKMGLPDGAVRNAMQRDGVDVLILDLDPEKSLKSQRKEETKETDDPPLKDDPKYQKYFKMLKMGLPDGAVRNAMQRDDVDVSILDFDPEKSIKSQTKQEESDDQDPPLKDDPKYQKYFKMLKMGLPEGAVRNAMERDSVDVSILDLDPEKSLKSQTKGGNEADDGIPIKDDPAFQKYFKMRKMGLPEGAVRNAMERDGVDTAVLDLDPEKSLQSQTNGDKEVDNGIPIKDDPAFQKYFKMQKMGLPEGAVRNAMERDGVDSSILDLDPEKSLEFQKNGSAAKDDGVPLKDDPEWSKYFKMLSMGLPVGAVKNAVQRDGKDPAILDLDHSKSIASQTKSSNTRCQPPAKKKRVRRKKIYWNPLDSGQIKANSLWSRVKGRMRMSELKYDEKEFADLFTESADPADKKKKTVKKDSSKTKKSVQVIDGKRSMNGGIILARLKIDYKKIADMVDKMNHAKLDATSLKALKEMLPTPEEKGGLLNYMKRSGSSEEAQQKAYADFSECEKYMYTMLNVSDAAAKFDCMLFRSQFKVRYNELVESIQTVEAACDEVRNSEKLQTIMAMILTLVNQINTGGDGNEAAGFTLDALLKLNEAKAFDKKTSVLHYLVKLVKQNDEALLDVLKELGHVKEAELVILDTLCSDIKALKDEIAPIHETVKAQADELEAAGKLVQMSLKELSEQRTSVRNIASIPQYNKIDHHTGRTPMERFTVNAEERIAEALAFTDQVKGKFAELLDFFGEDESMASNDFFGTMTRFLAELKKAVEHVDRAEQIRKKEEARQAKANAKKEKKEARATSSSLAVAGRKKVDDSTPAKDARKAEAPALSGIAAMAAAAAAKKKAKTDAPSPNGIAASAAAAPSKKKTEKATKENDKAEAPALSGIAAMAAAAAKKKAESGSTIAKGKTEAPALSGIAAMAAAAAKRKAEAEATEKTETPARNTIAASAAAAASLKKTEKAAKENALSGIAAMAAAAAKKKAENGNKRSAEEMVDMPALSGIAAMAAAAAKHTVEKTETTEKTEAPARNAIAASAAAAASMKKTETEAEESANDKKELPSQNSIAALAAAAAKKKAGTGAEASSNKKTEAPSSSSIASMAAAAASKKNAAKRVENEVDKKREVPTLSGIAAMAAAAAASKKYADKGVENEVDKKTETPAVGDIEAMAAASAAAKKNVDKGVEKEIDKKTETPVISGIAAIAAASAAAKKNAENGSETENSENTEAPALNSFGALATVAADEKNSEKEAEKTTVENTEEHARRRKAAAVLSTSSGSGVTGSDGSCLEALNDEDDEMSSDGSSSMIVTVAPYAGGSKDGTVTKMEKNRAGDGSVSSLSLLSGIVKTRSVPPNETQGINNHDDTSDPLPSLAKSEIEHEKASTACSNSNQRKWLSEIRSAIAEATVTSVVGDDTKAELS